MYTPLFPPAKRGRRIILEKAKISKRAQPHARSPGEGYIGSVKEKMKERNP
jgi:hypothetical protein